MISLHWPFRRRPRMPAPAYFARLYRRAMLGARVYGQVAATEIEQLRQAWALAVRNEAE